jgi:hypothetical protein
MTYKLKFKNACFHVYASFWKKVNLLTPQSPYVEQESPYVLIIIPDENGSIPFSLPSPESAKLGEVLIHFGSETTKMKASRRMEFFRFIDNSKNTVLTRHSKNLACSMKLTLPE